LLVVEEEVLILVVVEVLVDIEQEHHTQ